MFHRPGSRHRPDVTGGTGEAGGTGGTGALPGPGEPPPDPGLTLPAKETHPWRIEPHIGVE